MPYFRQIAVVAEGEESIAALGLGRLLVLFVDRSFGACEYCIQAHRSIALRLSSYIENAPSL